ncbi:MAG TPA: methyltransferase domain-containing protein [Anaerolineales bacterium]|nr:methyltransferase domain-containing protein [Anaerolineales bacterium]
MNENQTGQVTRNAAETYDEFFVPALFEEWAERIVEATQVSDGQHVLDVACGTGVLARAAANRVGPKGSVTGLDVNDGMLAIAERKAPHIQWKQGRAESLPFDDDSFDAVVSQFGLMFFEDRSAAIHEMSRVLSPGGRLAIAVWDRLENTPGYAAMAALLKRLFGTQTAEALYAPFSLGDKETLRPVLNDPRLQDLHITTLDGTARFSSIDSWVFTEIKGWTLSDRIDEEQYQELLEEAKKELAPFVLPDGKVEFRAPAHIVMARKQ